MRCLYIDKIAKNFALEKNQEYPVILTTSETDVILERALTILTIIDDDGMCYF